MARRIGLNMFAVGSNAGGIGRYARELTGALLAVAPDARLTAFVNRDPPADLLAEPWAGEVDWVRLPARPGGPPGHVLVELGVQTAAIARAARQRRLDVVHGLANVVPLIAPGFATVVTVHDLTWLHRPDAIDRRAALGARLQTFASARRASRVVTVSEHVARDVVASIGVDPERVEAVAHGVSAGPLVDPRPAAELRAQLRLGEGPVVLCVAQKRRHKNLAGLVRALAALDRPDVRLVLPGEPTDHERELRALARDLGVADRVLVLGYVDEPTLEGLYATAACVVLPSFEEGFGMPVLEAMRRERPVACSDASALPEAAGGAALLFDPHDPTAIAAAVGTLLGDAGVCADLVERGRRRAAELTWERTARATLMAYERAIDG